MRGGALTFGGPFRRGVGEWNAGGFISHRSQFDSGPRNGAHTLEAKMEAPVSGIIFKRTGKHFISRCGDPCNDRTLHFMYVYDLAGKKMLAVYCNRCSTMTMTDMALPEEIHAFSDPLGG